MPRTRLAESFADFLQTLTRYNIKAPRSIQLAGREDAANLLKQIKGEGLFIGATSYDSIVDKIESEELLGFLLFNIEFWWRPSTVTTTAQPGNY